MDVKLYETLEKLPRKNLINLMRKSLDIMEGNTSTRTKMNESVYKLLMKLPKKNVINLMWKALGLMESSGTKERHECILEALASQDKDYKGA
jgi:hypothetical protein